MDFTRNGRVHNRLASFWKCAIAIVLLGAFVGTETDAYERVIFVAGMRRGGTTHISHALQRALHADYVHEPLHRYRPKFPNMSPHDEWYRVWRAGHAESQKIESWLLSIMNDNTSPKHRETLIWKDPFSSFAMEYLMELCERKSVARECYAVGVVQPCLLVMNSIWRAGRTAGHRYLPHTFAHVDAQFRQSTWHGVENTTEYARMPVDVQRFASLWRRMSYTLVQLQHKYGQRKIALVLWEHFIEKHDARMDGANPSCQRLRTLFPRLNCAAMLTDKRTANPPLHRIIAENQGTLARMSHMLYQWVDHSVRHPELTPHLRTL